MKIDKPKRAATIWGSDGWKLAANFHLRQYAQEHSGRETIVDVLNSKATFIPLEDLHSDEILFVNKGGIMFVELGERDLSEETIIALEIPVKLTLLNGETLTGSFLIDRPPERSRLSDYLNFMPQFLYLCREEGDVVLNKAYIHVAKDRGDR